MLTLLAQATDEVVDLSTTSTDTAAATGIIAGMGVFFLVFMLLGIALLILNIWMLIDCAGRQEADFPNNNKNMWLILLIAGLIFSFGWLVAIIYYFSVKKKAGGNSGASAPTQGTGTDTAAK